MCRNRCSTATDGIRSDSTIAYLSPNVLSAIVNYKHHKFSITPALTFNEGQPYGNPGRYAGHRPPHVHGQLIEHSTLRSMHQPAQADYTSCGLAATQNGTSAGDLFIPNPQTASSIPSVRSGSPSQLNLSLSMGYQITPRIKANLLLANLRTRVSAVRRNRGPNSFRPTHTPVDTFQTTTTCRTSTTVRRRTTGTRTAWRSIPRFRNRIFRRMPTRTRWYCPDPLTPTCR